MLFRSMRILSIYDLKVSKNNFTLIYTIHFFFEAAIRIIYFLTISYYIMTNLNKIWVKESPKQLLINAKEIFFTNCVISMLYLNKLWFGLRI